METFKAKYIKIEIDGITYAGFLQEVKEAAAETTAPMTKYEFQKFLKDYVSPDILGDPGDTA